MSAAKRKGTAWESAVRDRLREAGVPAYRPAQEGFKDVGDIHGVSPFVIQCKDYRDIVTGLREGLDGVQKQKVHAGEEFGVAVVKRARKGAGEAYAVMRLDDWIDVLKRLRAADAQPLAPAPID